MSLSPVPRIRPPTFATPPHGLDRVIVFMEDANCLKIEAPFSDEEKNSAEVSKLIWYAMWDIFGAASFLNVFKFKVNLDLSSVDQLQDLVQELSIEKNAGNPNEFTVSREWWYQHYQIFVYPHLNNCQLVITPGKKLQSEMPPPTDTVYERYVNHLDSYFCLSIFGDSSEELDLLHSWLNDPRVDQYWKDAGDRQFHEKWLQDRYEDAHVLPILGSFRGTNGTDKSNIEPFAYYEIYWAAEDKISKAITTEPFDRGIHMLVGSNLHRGPHRVSSWLPSLAHFIFADDYRTRRILSEPDHCNEKMISYLQKFGFKKVKEYDMGHKIAAIMVLEKEDFWKHCPL